MMLRSRMVLGLGILVVVAGTTWSSPDETKAMAPEELESLHRMIKPQPGESLWMQIPWQVSVWEARKMAAAEGKPIFIWAGSGGGPVGVC